MATTSKPKGTPPLTASVCCCDEHAGHFTFSIINPPYGSCTDDVVFFSDRTQKDTSVAISSFRVVEIRQPGRDEISYKRIRMIAKVLIPDGFNELPSRRCVAGD